MTTRPHLSRRRELPDRPQQPGFAWIDDRHHQYRLDPAAVILSAALFEHRTDVSI
jgi:hypothetical protein